MIRRVLGGALAALLIAGQALAQFPVASGAAVDTSKGWQSGQVYGFGSSEASVGATPCNTNVVCAFPVDIPAGTPIKSMAIRTSSAGGTGNVKMGLYAVVNGCPVTTTPVAVAPAQALTGTTTDWIVDLTGGPFTLSGRYALAIIVDTASPQLVSTNGNDPVLAAVVGGAAVVNIMGTSGLNLGWTMTSAYASGLVAWSGCTRYGGAGQGSIPYIGLKVN